MDFKKVLLSVVSAGMFMGMVGCSNTNSKSSSSATEYKNFKTQYESLNNDYDEESGNTFRTVKIKKDNPIQQVEADDIVTKINEKETFVVFFGYAECPWCRSMVSEMINSAKNNKIKTIYYVDIQNIRDQKEYDSASKSFANVTEGSDAYMKLIKKFKNVLDDYDVSYTDESTGETKSVSAKEKRIYAPTLLYVENGKAKEMIDGLSDKQESSYDEITDEMKAEMEAELNGFFSKVKKQINACSVDESSKC